MNFIHLIYFLLYDCPAVWLKFNSVYLLKQKEYANQFFRRRIQNVFEKVSLYWICWFECVNCKDWKISKDGITSWNIPNFQKFIPWNKQWDVWSGDILLLDHKYVEMFINITILLHNHIIIYTKSQILIFIYFTKG